MDKERKDVRNKLSHIRNKQEFESIMDKIILSKREKDVLTMRYINKMSFVEIGDKIGLSEARVIQVHKDILDAVKSII